MANKQLHTLFMNSNTQIHTEHLNSLSYHFPIWLSIWIFSNEVENIKKKKRKAYGSSKLFSKKKLSSAVMTLSFV